MKDMIYRAWYPKENKMIKDSVDLEILFLDQLNDYEHEPIDTIGFHANHEGRIVDMMLYSTWKDVLGNFVCDGDILYDSDWGNTWYIEYTGTAFAARGYNGLAVHMLYELPHGDIEIIGNKYEGLKAELDSEKKKKGEDILSKLTTLDDGKIIATSSGLRAGKKWWQI
jgi:hypothetical protein